MSRGRADSTSDGKLAHRPSDVRSPFAVQQVQLAGDWDELEHVIASHANGTSETAIGHIDSQHISDRIQIHSNEIILWNGKGNHKQLSTGRGWIRIVRRRPLCCLNEVVQEIQTQTDVLPQEPGARPGYRTGLTPHPTPHTIPAYIYIDRQIC